MQGRKTYVEKFSMVITSKKLVGYLNDLLSQNH